MLRPSGIGDDLVKNATTGGTNPIIKAEMPAFGLPHQSPSIAIQYKRENEDDAVTGLMIVFIRVRA